MISRAHPASRSKRFLQRTISIVLADDHALLRQLVARALSAEPGFSVLGVADNAERAEALCIQINPHVVVLDIDMPGKSSFQAAAAIQTVCPDTQVVFLSAFDQDRLIDQALAVEASGYVTKSEPLETLIRAIRVVRSGKCFFSSDVLSRIVVHPRSTGVAKKHKTRGSTLTQRENEILHHIACGAKKKQIARLIHRSVKTVDRHACQLMDKLNIHDRVELSRFTIREGLAEA